MNEACLIYKGKPMDESGILDKHPVQKGSVLRIAYRMNGGPNRPRVDQRSFQQDGVTDAAYAGVPSAGAGEVHGSQGDARKESCIATTSGRGDEGQITESRPIRKFHEHAYPSGRHSERCRDQFRTYGCSASD